METWQKAVRILLLVAVLALTGCTNTQQAVIPTSAPTQDLNVVRTEAAGTVVAQITADALANPSATPTLAPTETPLPPTDTPTPASATLTPIVTATMTRVASSGGGSFYPTNTGTPYTDQAQFVGQSIPDGKFFSAGQDFDMKWTVKNTGARDWNTEFYIKYLSGNLEPSKNKIYMLTSVVHKNDTVDLLADFVAPQTPGRYTSNWAIINDDGVAFFHMYLVINVN